jgi:hypothetical protein
MRDGKVTKAELVSSEEAGRRRVLREQRDAEAARLAAERRAALAVEGQALLAEKKADPAFSLLPASEQVEFWRSFRARYPDVNANLEYAAALRRLDEELAKRAVQRESDAAVRDLESRVIAAESRALEAERRADEAERDRERERSRYSYGWYYPAAYYTPVVNYPLNPIYPTPKPCPPPAVHPGPRLPHSSGVTATMRLQNGPAAFNVKNSASLYGNSVDVIQGRWTQ